MYSYFCVEELTLIRLYHNFTLLLVTTKFQLSRFYKNSSTDNIASFERFVIVSLRHYLVFIIYNHGQVTA